jgi:hypothetical protein
MNEVIGFLPRRCTWYRARTESILWLDPAEDDGLADAQKALSQTARRLCKEGLSPNAIGVRFNGLA